MGERQGGAAYPLLERSLIAQPAMGVRVTWVAGGGLVTGDGWRQAAYAIFLSEGVTFRGSKALEQGVLAYQGYFFPVRETQQESDECDLLLRGRGGQSLHANFWEPERGSPGCCCFRRLNEARAFLRQGV